MSFFVQARLIHSIHLGRLLLIHLKHPGRFSDARPEARPLTTARTYADGQVPSPFPPYPTHTRAHSLGFPRRQRRQPTTTTTTDRSRNEGKTAPRPRDRVVPPTALRSRSMRRPVVGVARKFLAPSHTEKGYKLSPPAPFPFRHFIFFDLSSSSHHPHIHDLQLRLRIHSSGFDPG